MLFRTLEVNSKAQKINYADVLKEVSTLTELSICYYV